MTAFHDVQTSLPELGIRIQISLDKITCVDGFQNRCIWCFMMVSTDLWPLLRTQCSKKRIQSDTLLKLGVWRAEAMKSSLLLIGHIGCGESQRSVALIQSASIKTRRALLWMRSSVCCACVHVYAVCTFQLYCSTYTRLMEWMTRSRTFWKIRSWCGGSTGCCGSNKGCCATVWLEISHRSLCGQQRQLNEALIKGTQISVFT